MMPVTRGICRNGLYSRDAPYQSTVQHLPVKLVQDSGTADYFSLPKKIQSPLKDLTKHKRSAIGHFGRPGRQIAPSMVLLQRVAPGTGLIDCIGRATHVLPALLAVPLTSNCSSFHSIAAGGRKLGFNPLWARER